MHKISDYTSGIKLIHVYQQIRRVDGSPLSEVRRVIIRYDTETV